MTYTTTTRPELTDFTNADGSKRMAGPGGVRQTGGNRPVKECGACGGAVAFVESKNGKWYLADCFMGRNGGYYYVKASAHFKTCGERVAKKAEINEVRNREQARDDFYNEFDAWECEQLDAGVTVTREEFMAKRQELKAKYGLS